MANSKIPSREILIEEAAATFVNGITRIDDKSGYVLLAVYAIKRDSSEYAAYGLLSMQGNSDGGYDLLNRQAINAGLWIRLFWVKA